MIINNNSQREYYSTSNQPAILNVDRRNSQFSKYRSTIDKLNEISDRLENFSEVIEGILIKKG